MPTTNGRIGHLLIVEPESLLRWSLATYLSKWFDVFPTDSGEAALRILDDHRVDGAVISDQLAPGSAPAITARLGLRNPNATIVYTVTNAETSVAEDRVIHQIEKPFQLEHFPLMCSDISASCEESSAVVGRDRVHGVAHGAHELAMRSG
ncbi:MAG: hypothetical protein IIC02_08940, partial [Planctomycetes bacterium]|nr:hypothetical protein [Planctomycetota bacterium]